MGLHQNIYTTLFPYHQQLAAPAPVVAQPAAAPLVTQPQPAPISTLTAPVPPLTAGTPQVSINDGRSEGNGIEYVPPDFSNFGVPGPPPGAPQSPLDQESARYASLIASHAEKQPAWKTALFLALQGINKTFNPQDQSPIKFLGEEKRDRAIAESGQKLGALQMQDQQRKAAAAAQRKALKDEADYRHTVAQTNALTNKPEYDRAMEALKFDNLVKMEERRRKAEGEKYDNIFKPDGTMWRQYKDGSKPLEPVNDPQGNQIVDPDKKFYQTNSPITGTPVQLKGGELQTNETTLAVGDAARALQADQFNASQELEAQKTNATNIGKYFSDSLALAQQLAGQQGKNIENLAELQGYENQTAKLNEQLSQINPKDPNDFSGEKFKKYNEILSKIGDIDTKYQKALGATDAGKFALGELQKRGIQRPPTVHAVKVQAQQVGSQGGRYSGKTYDLSKTRQFFPGKSDTEIKQIITAQGGTVQ